MTLSPDVDETRRIRVLLQARTTSRRLPAKVLLPLGGVPLAILCAKRLGNTGREVVLATSVDVTDDVLARRAASAGVLVCRGSLDDVLSRFIVALKDLADRDIVIRATADNPLPDGNLIDALVKMFLQQDLTYLGTDPPSDGLPHGLSAEVFDVGILRQRANLAPTPFDREHVTPTLRKPAPGSRLLKPCALISQNCSHLRCTVDTLDDYLEMAMIFDHCHDPVGTPWQDFLSKLPSERVDTNSDTDARKTASSH